MPESRIRLRDATIDDADLLDSWETLEALGEFNYFGAPKSSKGEALAKGPLRDDRNGTLIVEVIETGEPIGTVGWHGVGYGPNSASRAWNIGIALIPSARGQGYGGEAQRELADELFRTTDANRVEASTDVANIPEQRSLEKAGFSREGVQRGSQMRGGGYHDLVTYSRLRSDP